MIYKYLVPDSELIVYLLFQKEARVGELLHTLALVPMTLDVLQVSHSSYIKGRTACMSHSGHAHKIH